MITYEARYAASGQAIAFSDLAFALQHKSSPPHSTLWQIERESEAEAAVRRMGYLESRLEKLKSGLPIPIEHEWESVSQFADRLCPPPASKETQLDWNAGEPIEKIYSWTLPSGISIASLNDKDTFLIQDSDSNYLNLLLGNSATASTEAAAIANLRAIRASLKSQTR